MTVFPSLQTLDSVCAVTDRGTFCLSPTENGWANGDLQVSTRFEAAAQRLDVALQSDLPVRRVELRWRTGLPAQVRILGDAWERGYGDLAWREAASQQVLPWYFLVCDGTRVAGYGVETGANAFCHWTIEAQEITLHLDVRCGGTGVWLGERVLDVAKVRFLQCPEASPFEFARRFCRALCPAPRLPAAPIYGGNDWYHAYGSNSRDSVLRDAATISELAPCGENRPFMVIDDGWQACHGPHFNGGPWHIANERFGEMGEVADAMKAHGVRPGVWFRPLLSALELPDSWHFCGRAAPPPEGLPLDPSVPKVLDLVAADVRRFRDWGFELVKHDFSTFDIFWKWGFDFGDDPARGGENENVVSQWHFADRGRTTAEIVKALYATMRNAAGEEMLLLGCNTVGHLGAGYFEIQRTGDDTSGREWERTRQMGVNTLAFRMAQHEAFFAVDADCVGLTRQIPWNLNRQWLDLLSRSGTPLFVSAAPDALGREQKAALRQAFALAAQPQPIAEPLDWLQTSCPAAWRCGDEIKNYRWFE